MQGDTHDPIGIALRVGRAILACGGEDFVGGSLASCAAPQLVAELGEDFEIDAEALRAAVRTGTSTNVFRRGRVRAASARGGPGRRARDVVRVLAVSHSVLDGAYLDAWAKRLGLVDLLGRAWDEAARA